MVVQLGAGGYVVPVHSSLPSWQSGHLPFSARPKQYSSCAWRSCLSAGLPAHLISLVQRWTAALMSCLAEVRLAFIIGWCISAPLLSKFVCFFVGCYDNVDEIQWRLPDQLFCSRWVIAKWLTVVNIQQTSCCTPLWSKSITILMFQQTVDYD